MYALLVVLALPLSILAQVDIEARPTPSCEKLPYKKTCDDLGVPSQFTLRYFVKDGKCCSYPYGWCPADEINLQAAIRTKEDCEAFCLRGEPANPDGSGSGSSGHGHGSQGTGNGGPSGPGGNGANYGPGGPTGPGVFGSGRPGAQGGSGAQGVGGGLSGLQDTSSPPVKTCERQEYRDFCPVTQSASQFTLRWYVRDGMCCSYPWGFCPGDELAFETSIRTKDECEEFCLGKAPTGGSGHGHGGSGPSGSGPAGPSGNGGSGSGSLGTGNGGAGSSGSGAGGPSGSGPGYTAPDGSGSGSAGTGAGTPAVTPAAGYDSTQAPETTTIPQTGYENFFGPPDGDEPIALGAMPQIPTIVEPVAREVQATPNPGYNAPIPASTPGVAPPQGYELDLGTMIIETTTPETAAFVMPQIPTLVEPVKRK